MEEKNVISNAARFLLVGLSYTDPDVKMEHLAHVGAEDWRSVVELAGQHGVLPLLYHYLKPLNLTLPDDIEGQILEGSTQQVLRNFRMYRKLGRLLEILKKKNITVIALKGAYLAEAVYDNIGLRSMCDIDLLVKKDDLPRVEQELMVLGGVPDDHNRIITPKNHHFAFHLPKEDLSVEIHWAIIGSQYPFRIDVDEMWSRAQPVTLAQVPVWALSLEDMLLHLCLHTSQHTLRMQLRMLCDIGEIVRCYGSTLNWQEMGARAREWGIVRVVYMVLRLSQELLEVAIPADWLDSIRPVEFDERYLSLAREQLLVTHMDMDDRVMTQAVQTARVWGAKGLRNKIMLIRDHFLPSRESMALLYPAPADSGRIYLYYFVHLKDVLVRRGAIWWRLLCGDSKMRAAAKHTKQIDELRDWLMSK